MLSIKVNEDNASSYATLRGNTPLVDLCYALDMYVSTCGGSIRVKSMKMYSCFVRIWASRVCTITRPSSLFSRWFLYPLSLIVFEGCSFTLSLIVLEEEAARFLPASSLEPDGSSFNESRMTFKKDSGLVSTADTVESGKVFMSLLCRTDFLGTYCQAR
jgi:hypothetical protein